MTNFFVQGTRQTLKLYKHSSGVEESWAQSKHVIDDDAYNQLFVSGAQPGIMYGLPKVHERVCPLRPLLSAVSTVNYKLTKYLVPINTQITRNEYTVMDSFSLDKEISNFSFDNCTIASFDITSLFTNKYSSK